MCLPDLEFYGYRAIMKCFCICFIFVVPILCVQIFQESRPIREDDDVVTFWLLLLLFHWIVGDINFFARFALIRPKHGENKEKKQSFVRIYVFGDKITCTQCCNFTVRITAADVAPIRLLLELADLTVKLIFLQLIVIYYTTHNF